MEKGLGNKNVVGVLTTDLSKAFDSLHLPPLLAKLKAYICQTKQLKCSDVIFSSDQEIEVNAEMLKEVVHRAQICIHYFGMCFRMILRTIQISMYV